MYTGLWLRNTCGVAYNNGTGFSVTEYRPVAVTPQCCAATLPMLDKRQTGMGVHQESQAIIAPNRPKAPGGGCGFSLGFVIWRGNCVTVASLLAMYVP